MFSKQPDSMPNTDADAPGALVSDAVVSDAVVISENADTDTASAEDRASESVLPATASGL